MRSSSCTRLCINLHARPSLPSPPHLAASPALALPDLALVSMVLPCGVLLCVVQEEKPDSKSARLRAGDALSAFRCFSCSENWLGADDDVDLKVAHSSIYNP